MVRLIKMFLVLVMVLIGGSVVQAQVESFEVGKRVIRGSLKGLKGMYVMVGNYPDIKKDGLRESTIKTDVELKLRMAGIKVLTKEECIKDPGNPYLWIGVHSFKNEIIDIYAYCIIVELKQRVILSRDKKIECPATTWFTTVNIGTVGANNVNSLRDNIKDRVDVFINDYLAVNPKE